MTTDTDQSAKKLLDALRAVLSEIAEPSQLLKTILGQAVGQTGAQRGVFVEVIGSTQIAYRVLYHFDKEQLAGNGSAFSRGVFAEVLRTLAPVRLANAVSDPAFNSRDSVQNLKLISVLCMPIPIDGQPRALVHLESSVPGHFTDEHERLLGSLIEVAGPALAAMYAGENVIAERRALEQSQVELEQSREFLAHEWSFGRFIGRSEAVRSLAEAVRRASRTEFPVLLAGETGTGKSVLARVVHHSSPRATKAFSTLFCPSLERGMVETELFGHKRGAFTGAVSDRVGKVQAADGGTLFLDEIGELPMPIQPKLLRLLQEKSFERVGDPTERRADVRVVAASNRDLEDEVRHGRFRRDLYERLNFLPIRVPPLRERREDLPLLLRHFLDQHEATRWIELSPAGARFLVDLDFSWPGNVRHLEHLAARVAAEGVSEPLGPAHLRRLLDASSGGRDSSNAAAGADLDAGLPALLEQTERAWIEEALRRYPDLSRSEIAGKLKIGESTLYKKLRQYGIEV